MKVIKDRIIGALQQAAEGSEGIRYRMASPDDATSLALLYNNVYKGGYPIQDCLQPDRIKKIIESGEHIWMVALDRNDLVGAAVARPEAWNRSYETCRTVTLPDPKYRGRGIGRKLYEVTLSAAMLHSDCDLVYGFPRTAAMKHLVEATKPKAGIVGTDFGMHLVSREREIHLWDMALNPMKKCKRNLTSLPAYLKQQTFDEILGKFEYATVAAASSVRFVVGPPAENIFESTDGAVHYNRFAPSKHAFVTHIDSDNVEGMVQALHNFTGMMRKRLGHVSLFALADKSEFLLRLCSDPPSDEMPKFQISAYLPAWHCENGARFDCVHVAARLDKRTPKTNDLGDVVQNLHDMFSIPQIDKERLGQAR